MTGTEGEPELIAAEPLARPASTGTLAEQASQLGQTAPLLLLLRGNA